MGTSVVQTCPTDLRLTESVRTLGDVRSIALAHRVLTAVVLLAFTSLVAILDFATGDDIPLMVLYLPAIVASCWLLHIGCGVALSLVCSCLWLVDDVLLLEQSASIGHKYWLAIVHLLFFGVVVAMTWRLRLAQERERALARTDALTGLANRKAFLESIDLEIARSQRTRQPLSIAYLDCDNFKQVNDTLGHAAGDALLIAVAETAAANIRPTDVVARLGGDEFACLLPGTSAAQAEEIVRRLQQRLNGEMDRNDWPVTFSIGIAVFESSPRDADQLIGAADELMYQVKQGEKNALRVQRVGENSICL